MAQGSILYSVRKTLKHFTACAVSNNRNSVQLHLQDVVGDDYNPTLTSILLDFKEFKQMRKRKSDIIRLMQSQGTSGVLYVGNIVLIKTPSGLIRVLDLVTRHVLDLTHEGCWELVQNMNTLYRMMHLLKSGRFHDILEVNGLL